MIQTLIFDKIDKKYSELIIKNEEKFREFFLHFLLISKYLRGIYV